MNILTQFASLAALSSLFSFTMLAGPGPQYWQNRSAIQTLETAKQSTAAAVVTCAHMLVPNTGPTASRVPFVSVNCSAEMLRANADCQSACGVTSAPKTEVAPAALTCSHMLVRNTGPTAGRVPWVSVNCTSEMMRTNPDCQTACVQATNKG